MGQMHVTNYYIASFIDIILDNGTTGTGSTDPFFARENGAVTLTITWVQ